MHATTEKTAQQHFEEMVITPARNLEEAFTQSEMLDVALAAQERGVTVYELVHGAVMEDLYR